MKQIFVMLRKGAEIFKPFKRHLAVMLTFLIGVELLGLMAPYVIGRLLNALQKHRSMEHVLLLTAVAMLVSLVSSWLGRKKDVYETQHLDFSIGAHLTEKTLTKILSLSIGQHRSQHSGITQSVVSKGQSTLQQLMNLLLYQFLPAVTQTAIALALLLWFNLLIGSMVIAGATLFVWLTIIQNKELSPKVKRLIDESHKSGKSYGEILRYLGLVQVNAQEKRVTLEHKVRITNQEDLGRSTWIPYLVNMSTREAVVICTRYAALLTAILLYYKGKMFVGDLLIIWAWSNQALSQIWMIGGFQRQLMLGLGEIRKYFSILDIEPDISIVENPIRPDHIAGRIEFKNVTFTYPTHRYIELDDAEEKESESPTQPALVDVNFAIEPGERVAFVGESGAGKSTIMSLLVRAYDPDHGQILIDGHDLRLLDLKKFREAVGLVEQNVMLFDNTIRYNMLFGLNGKAASVTDVEIEEVARISRIDQFKSRLTGGWDTKIGENGVQLSGGQRQRISIARALLKTPSLLILDEATSNLDPKNERAIKEAVDSASSGRTTIIIAHRLSTVKDADRIYVMDKGKIVDVGTHNELCGKSSVYQELVSEQLIHS